MHYHYQFGCSVMLLELYNTTCLLPGLSSDDSHNVKLAWSHALKPEQLGFNFWQAGELAESVSKIIDSQFADIVDMSDVQVLFIS